MPLEAVIVVIDNSEWMRNGDFSPSRFQAQLDAVNMICGHKTNSNVENTVGVISMGGNSCEVLAALTSDLGKVLSELHRVKIHGQPHFSDSIQIAQLALKHRQNKRQEQKIIIFVGSPIDDTEADLKRLGTRLKKNKVGVDVINFGEEATNTSKLEAFIQSVNSGENSHLITVPAGPHILADILISSPVIGGDGVPGMDGGIDPSVDPELALALRLSLEESQRATQPPPGPAATQTPATPVAASGSNPDAMDIDTGVEEEEDGEDGEEVEEDEDDEEAAMARAIAMSMGGAPGARDVPMTEEEEMELAMRMSLQTQAEEEKVEAKSPSSAPSSQSTTEATAPTIPGIDLSALADDPEAMEAVLSNLPGVDPNDPSIKSLLESLKKKDDK